jgi:preprotein translocase YajC subunit
MTHLPALLHLLAATSSTKKSSSDLPFLILIVVALGGYFLFLRPQQRKNAAARRGVGAAGYEVGDEVQTIGGVIGTILEIHGDRYTLLTGSTGSDGNLDGAQPTRIVFVRQAIARKVDPVVVADPDPVSDVHVHEDVAVDADEDFDAGGEHDHDHDHDDEAEDA